MNSMYMIACGCTNLDSPCLVAQGWVNWTKRCYAGSLMEKVALLRDWQQTSCVAARTLSCTSSFVHIGSGAVY